MLGGVGSPSGDDLLTVTVVSDDNEYGMKVSGDNPVYVQSVKEHGAAWRSGLRSGDKILRVNGVAVHNHMHQQVVQMIRANSTTVLTVQQNSSRHKTPITAPVPVNQEKQRQLEAAKAKTFRLMLEQEQKYIRDLRNELSKVPDVRKQAELESAEQRCSTLQHSLDAITTGHPTDMSSSHPQLPTTPKLNARSKHADKTGSPPPNNTIGFLSGIPRSLSNLTGQSLRNLRQARQKMQQENQPPHFGHASDMSESKRHSNNSVTCIDNVTPPPLPPRSTERPKRSPLSPGLVNPLAKPKPSGSAPAHKYYKTSPPMHQSMPSPYKEDTKQFRKSSHSLDGELDGPQPNSIALQMSYPLVNVPPPPLQTDNRSGLSVMHVRSQSSPEHLDHSLQRSNVEDKEAWERGTPPPGTPPPPYAHNTQPCADPQRAIISMEEDDSPASDNSTYSGLFSNVRCVRESNVRMAVLLNWLLSERRCASANLLLVITEGYRSDATASLATLRRWAYEIQSTFLMPNAVLQLSGVDENMANEIEHVLVNEYEKEEILRSVFRKARAKAKEELGAQLSEFQVKRQVGLGTLYGPEDAVLARCLADRAHEQLVVERLMCARLTAVHAARDHHNADRHAALLAALVAAAVCLQCSVVLAYYNTMVNLTELSECEAREVRRRWWQSPKNKAKKKNKQTPPAAVAAAVGGSRGTFLQRDKHYKQRVKQLAKQHPQPFVVRGHHLQLQALTSVGHCHHCDHVIWGLAPQAYVCTDCKLRVHRACARLVEEGCCLDGEHHSKRISRFMERIHNHASQPPNNQDSNERKSKKSSNTAHFLNMERSTRKIEDEQQWETSQTRKSLERRDESDESLYESADCHSDAISASDDALPKLMKTPTMSKESLKIAITDEEVELVKPKKTHRKTMSLSNPLEMVRNFGDEWFETNKKDIDKNADKRKSKESLWSEEDRDSIHGSTVKLDQSRKNSKKEDKSQSNSRKSSSTDAPKARKTSKGSSVSALSLFRRKKTPTSMKPVEVVAEVVDRIETTEEILNYTKFFLEEEKRHTSACESKRIIETDTDDEPPTPKPGEHRRRPSRQTSRSKSKVRGKSQSVKVNTLRKTHSGTLKKSKKKGTKTPLTRSRQASIVDTPPMLKKRANSCKQNSWLFSASRGESRREGSADEQHPPESELNTNDLNNKDSSDKDTSRAAPSVGRGVNRAESCRERDAPRRGKHRNASDPNRLTAHNNHDLEPGSVTAPSGSSSSSSLSSKSNESNTVTAERHASQSDWSDEDEPVIPAQWADSLPPQVLESLLLPPRIRKRQEVIHELIVSEASHVKWLKVLARIFHRPLEAQPTLLPAEELAALFPNLHSVREHHARLYADLRTAREEAGPVVPLGPVADALLATLGTSAYAPSLSRFCRGQRMALDSLRERRRKHKELHQFLSAREQLPLCGRLQLRDLLACVWQRLTKYQLLLESIVKTVDEGEEDPDEVTRLRRALDVAKEVLQCVDAAIRTAENEHRLRTIQSKLEARAPSGAEWDEIRRLDLTTRTLRTEGELAIRTDNAKRVNVLALMLEDCLVLLQREGDRFLLKPFSQPNYSQLLSPIIRWDKVLFRPNAAERHTFFLMNINHVQMHELTASSAAEYATWVKHIQEAPLAKLAEFKGSFTSSHHASRSSDESGANVSRNPSDASERSAPIGGAEEAEPLTATPPTPPAPPLPPPPPPPRPSLEREASTTTEPVPTETKVREPATVGSITRQSSSPPALEPAGAVRVREARRAHAAATALSPRERMRRLDARLAAALRDKSLVVAEVLGVPRDSYSQLAELAVADTLGQVESEGPAQPEDMHQLLLAAQTQATQLTEMAARALNVSETMAMATRASGVCDSCRSRGRRQDERREQWESFDADKDNKEESNLLDGMESDEMSTSDASLGECGSWRGAELAARLAGAAGGLQGALGRVLALLPAMQADRQALRQQLAAARDANDALRQRLRAADPNDPPDQDQPSNGG